MRVVAVASDRVQVRGGVLVINGVPVSLGRRPDLAVTVRGETEPLQVRRETLPGGPSYLTGKRTGTGAANNTPETRVPPGHVFVLGDNRDNANDSRFLGPTPLANVQARALTIFRSPDTGRIGTSLAPLAPPPPAASPG